MSLIKKINNLSDSSKYWVIVSGSGFTIGSFSIFLIFKILHKMLNIQDLNFISNIGFYNMLTGVAVLFIAFCFWGPSEVGRIFYKQNSK